MPGTSAGLNHSLDIHACGRSRMPRACSSSFRVLRQSSSQVPSTVTLKLLRRCLSNCSSDSFSQGYFPRGIGIQKSQKTVHGWCHRIPPATTAESSRCAIVQCPRWLWVKLRSPGVQPASRLYPQLRTWPCTAQTDALCRYCCKSRKSNNPKNLAKADLWTSLLLRCFSTPLWRSVTDFG
jgi:hypothetical protein